MNSRSDSSAEVTVMLITSVLQQATAGGRTLLSRLNRDALAEIFGSRFETFEIEPRRLRGWRAVGATFGGYIDGLNNTVVASVIQSIRDKEVRKVFIDGSNFGKLVKAIKLARPDVEVCVFFHNCEARFFLGAFRHFKTVRSLGVLIANYLAERLAVRYSDKRICLSERDSKLLRKIYRHGGTHTSPMALRDTLPSPLPPARDGMAGTYALFVGGTFYANRLGIAWFVEHVAPRVATMTYIVGKGFESLRPQLERPGKVEVVGEVEDLAPWYLDAGFVVAPIFDGSGMKTKVAEALMFGKRVIGTPEAFSGYEEIADLAGSICATPDDFVRAFERESMNPAPRFDESLRSIYAERYSLSATCSRLREILS